MPSNRVILHVTSDDEARESLNLIPEAVTTVIPNGVLVPDELPPRTWLPDGIIRLLFIGRLHPKKGLENLFSALTLFDCSSVKLTVCGTGDRDYLASLREDVSRLDIGNQVLFVGHLDGKEKDKVFYSADVCMVPSHTENFGMVVAESLAHGVPVIVSKGAPWADIEKHNCGLWIDNSPEHLADAIRKIKPLDLSAMGKRGRDWMVRDYGWAKVADEMMSVYKKMARIYT
jgi:glycosyltransferase involved in cell wall biosynthesis